MTAFPQLCETLEVNHLRHCREHVGMQIQHKCVKLILLGVDRDVYNMAFEALLQETVREALALRLMVAEPRSGTAFVFPGDAVVVLPGIRHNAQVIIEPLTTAYFKYGSKQIQTGTAKACSGLMLEV